MNGITGIGRGVKIFVRYTEADPEPYNVITYNLLQFCEWINRARERGARIIPNGMTGAIVITKNRYMVAEVI